MVSSETIKLYLKKINEIIVKNELENEKKDKILKYCLIIFVNIQSKIINIANRDTNIDKQILNVIELIQIIINKNPIEFNIDDQCIYFLENIIEHNIKKSKKTIKFDGDITKDDNNIELINEITIRKFLPAMILYQLSNKLV
jgi:hypothetical protein